jgi:hypothetical protein
MKKSLIIITALAIAVCTAYFIRTAILSKQKSNDLLSKFKEVNSTLTSSSDSAVTKNGALQKVDIHYLMKSQMILLIDSLKENYKTSSEELKQAKSMAKLRLDLKRLLSYIHNYNQMKMSEVDSQMPDTIIYNSGLVKISGQKRQSGFFEGVPKEVSITYLNYLRNQVLKNN